MEKQDIVLSYETLFEISRIEKARSELSQLPATYLTEVKHMIELDKQVLAGNADANTKQKTKNNLNAIIKIVNEIGERRERKIVNFAMIKSRTKNAIVDFSKFLHFEKEIFDKVVNLLETKNLHFFFENDMNVSQKQIPLKEIEQPLPIPPDKKDQTKLDKNPIGEQKKLLMIRFTSAVPTFLGPELEEYGPFEEEDIASLPAIIARTIIDKKRGQEIRIEH